jgi:hypothetical protein
MRSANHAVSTVGCSGNVAPGPVDAMAFLFRRCMLAILL